MIRVMVACMWLSVLILEGGSIDGRNNTIQKVIVTGMGINENNAIKNATKAAIQQVVGMYVVSDVLMKNSKLIKDEVLTQSNAYVKSFKTLNKTKDEDGLFEVEAEVEVEVGKLTNTLGKLNIATKGVGTDEFKAVALTGFSASKDFKTMLDKVVMEPIRENKKIYDIKVNSFVPLQDDWDERRLRVRWAKKDKKLYESGELLPFELSFTFGLSDNYVSSIMSFLEHSSKKSSDTHVNVSYNYGDKSNKNIFAVYKVKKSPSISSAWDGREGLLKIYKSYLLSSRNAKIFEATVHPDIRKFILKVSLLDKNNEPVKNVYYGTNRLDGENEFISTQIFLKQSSMQRGNRPVIISGSPGFAHAFTGYLTSQHSSYYNDYKLYRPHGFIINRQELITYLFLNEDEASRVVNIQIEAQWQK